MNEGPKWPIIFILIGANIFFSMFYSLTMSNFTKILINQEEIINKIKDCEGNVR